MTKNFASEMLADAHKSESGLFQSGQISKESMDQLDRFCLSLEITGANCVPDLVEQMEMSDKKILPENGGEC